MQLWSYYKGRFHKCMDDFVTESVSVSESGRFFNFVQNNNNISLATPQLCQYVLHSFAARNVISVGANIPPHRAECT